jgi:hypothetical protein
MASRSIHYLALGAFLASACSPTLPPTTVPEASEQALESFRAALQTYVDQTQPNRKQAAQTAEQVAGKTTPLGGGGSVGSNP